MRKSKFTDSQIMDAVKRVEAGFGVPDICREMGISIATFYKWRAKYGGMDVSMMSPRVRHQMTQVFNALKVIKPTKNEQMSLL